VTEIRSIDLATTADTLMAVMPAGWESRPRALTVSPDGSQLAFIGPPEQVVEGRAGRNILQTAVWLLDLSTGEMTKISGDSSYAFTLRGSDRLVWADDDRLLAAVTDRTGSGLAEVVRDADGRWQVARLSGVGDDVAESIAIAAAGTRAAAVLSNPVRPRRLELLDLAGGSAVMLEEPNRILQDTWVLAPVADASFVGPSGDTIDAWWLEPTETFDDGKTPLVVYYYGGGTPRMRTFSFDFQFFAANGYAVLVLTPRGALGFEPSFADSHVNDWGPRSSADILAGVDAFLEAHPEIDEERIGIYGGSYGGFMTAYLLTVTDRFAAAVDLFGISNLASYWGDGAWGYTYGDVAGYGSFPWNAPEIYAGNSPLFRADKITTPLLLLHGMADANVPTHESEQLYAALQVLDRPTELVLFPDEDHGISGTWTNRVDHRTMMLEWFDLHLRGQPEAWQYRWSRN
jgi:dipeptidyl aminopeptidase/acylaminoacyl peptidase